MSRESTPPNEAGRIAKLEADVAALKTLTRQLRDHRIRDHRDVNVQGAKTGDPLAYAGPTKKGEWRPGSSAAALVAEVALGPQAIPNNVLTTLTFPATPGTWDYNYGLSVEPDPTNRIRVPAAGVYHIEAHVSFDENSLGERYVVVQDGSHFFIDGYAAMDATGFASFHGGRDAFLVASEAPFVRVRQNSGAGLMVNEARLSVRQVLVAPGPNPNGRG